MFKIVSMSRPKEDTIRRVAKPTTRMTGLIKSEINHMRELAQRKREVLAYKRRIIKGEIEHDESDYSGFFIDTNAIASGTEEEGAI